MWHEVAQLVKATSRNIAGSIFDRLFEIFYRFNSSGRCMALRSIQTPYRNDYQVSLLGAEGVWCLELTSADCLKIQEASTS
jgi:hypothetical protein